MYFHRGTDGVNIKGIQLATQPAHPRRKKNRLLDYELMDDNGNGLASSEASVVGHTLRPRDSAASF
jgi:hypothetical protein